MFNVKDSASGGGLPGESFLQDFKNVILTFPNLVRPGCPCRCPPLHSNTISMQASPIVKKEPELLAFAIDDVIEAERQLLRVSVDLVDAVGHPGTPINVEKLKVDSISSIKHFQEAVLTMQQRGSSSFKDRGPCLVAHEPLL